jgi:hypothetical protein
MRIPFPPHSHQHLLLFVFLMLAILTGMRWSLLICFSFMSRDVENFFMCFSGHLNFFLWKNSVQFIYLCLHWVINFSGNLTSWAPCIFWLLIFCQILSHYVGNIFNLVTISFLCRSFLISHSSTCQSILSVGLLFLYGIENLNIVDFSHKLQ